MLVVWGLAKTGRRKVAVVVTWARQGKRRRCLGLNLQDGCILPYLLPQEVVPARVWWGLGPVQSPLDPGTRQGIHRTS